MIELSNFEKNDACMVFKLIYRVVIKSWHCYILYCHFGILKKNVSSDKNRVPTYLFCLLLWSPPWFHSPLRRSSLWMKIKQARVKDILTQISPEKLTKNSTIGGTLALGFTKNELLPSFWMLTYMLASFQ